MIVREPSILDGALRQAGLSRADLGGHMVALAPTEGFLSRSVFLDFRDAERPLLINPEPASVTLMLTGLALGWLWQRRDRAVLTAR